MKKNFFVFFHILSILFILFSPSCSQDSITIDEINVLYVKDENNLYSIVLYFTYPRSENFEAAAVIKTKDGKYTWSAPFKDYVVNSNKYKAAGRFHLPDSALNGQEVDIELSYRDITEIYTLPLEYPQEKFAKENIDIFDLALNKTSMTNSYTGSFKKSLSRADEVVYFYDDKSTLSSTTKISSRNNTIRVSNDARSVTFVEKKSQDKNIFYIKSFDLEEMKKVNR